MGAERVAGYSSFMGRYNSYNVPLTDEEEKGLEAQAQAGGQDLTADDSTLSYVPYERHDADIHEIAESFSGRDRMLSDFSFGNEIETIDMRQAISDMQGDRLLQEYQYFVGSANQAGNVVSNTADGTVIKLG